MADPLLFIDRVAADADRAPDVLQAMAAPGAAHGIGRPEAFASARLAPSAATLSASDYAIGLHAASLIADGGTLQLGPDALGDALARSLIVRERHGEEYARLVAALAPEDTATRELGRFRQGLYGCSEFLSPGLLHLFEAGIVRREVYDDLALQQLVDEGRVPGAAVTPRTLQLLLARGRVHAPLRPEDLAFLQRHGILRPEVTLEGDTLAMGSKRCSADLRDEEAFELFCRYMLGTRLTGGKVVTAGTLCGPRDHHERLRAMPARELTRIEWACAEPGSRRAEWLDLARAQRQRARWTRTASRVSALGAAVCDARPGRWTPDAADPAGGCAAGAAPPADARRLLLLRATQADADGICSRIVWSCTDATEPQQRRDLVVTEYGVADLRGQSDRVAVERLVAVADSRFQDELVRQARAQGVLPPDYALPERHRHNLPQVIERKLRPWMQTGLLPARPFGSDAIADEPSTERVPPLAAGHGAAAPGGGRPRAAPAGADDDGLLCRPGTAAGERCTPAVPRHALLPAGGGALMRLG